MASPAQALPGSLRLNRIWRAQQHRSGDSLLGVGLNGNSSPRMSPSRRVWNLVAMDRPQLRHRCNLKIGYAGILTQTGIGALSYSTAPPTGLLGVGSSPRMIAF